MQVDRDDDSLAYAEPSDTTPHGTLCTHLDAEPFEVMLLHLHAVIDVAGLWSAIQSILDELVPNDAAVLYLNARDFSITSYLPRVFATPRASKFLKWMRHCADAPLIRASPGTRICQFSDVVFDPRHLHHAEFFRRYMAPAQWHHIACLLFWDQSKLTSEIVIMRTAAQGALNNHEIAALNRLHPHIEATLHRLIALEKRILERTGSGEEPRSGERSATDGWPGLLLETEQRSGKVRSIGTLPRATVTRMDTKSAEREFLTPAEAQLVHFLHAGLSNKEIATRLHKSVRTVKTQLTSIYRKYGVRSRTRLLATMNGATEHP